MTTIAAVEDTAVTELPSSDVRVDALLVEETLLVEDVSIDGMCGVY